MIETVVQELADRTRMGVTELCRNPTRVEREQLLRWAKTRTSPHRLVTRSRIILLASEGHTVAEIARRLSVTPATVRLWCGRFHRRGVGALERDAPGRGRRPGMSSAVVVEVLRVMVERHPPGAGWSTRSLAATAGTSPSTVWRVWRRYGLRPSSSRAETDRALRRAISETRDSDE